MATIFVDASAASNGSGTLSSPRNIPPTSVSYGDFVLFKANVTYVGSWTVPTPSGSGSDTNRLTIGTYDPSTGEQIVSLDVQATIQATGNGDAIFIDAVDYVTVEGLYLREAKTFPSAGLRARNCSYITARRNRINSGNYTAQSYGIRFDNATGSGFSRSHWTISENVVERTAGNAAIICVWSSTSGEYVTDITIEDNVVYGNPSAVAGGSNEGIIVIGRATNYYTDKAGLMSKGVRVCGNVVYGTHSYAFKWQGVQAGGSQLNVFERNKAFNIGDGATDMHCMWFAAVDDAYVRYNEVNGSNAWIGANQGTGVGIFVDKPSHDSDGCNRVFVIGNLCKNCGRKATLNTEVGGAGILVFLSSNIYVLNNVVESCSNGIVVIGWYGSGNKSSSIDIENNVASNSTYSNYYVCKAANSVSLKNNVSVNGNRGFYIENAGTTYVVTNYSELNNMAHGAASFNWAGGDEPTQTSVTISSRTPTNGNVTQSPILNDQQKAWLGFSYSSPCFGSGIAGGYGYDFFGKEATGLFDIGPFQKYLSRSIAARSIKNRATDSRSVTTNRRPIAGA